MAFNKFVAVLLVCLVFTSAFHNYGAEAITDVKFKSCFTDCVGQCLTTGRGYSFSEMGCDNDCTTKEIWDKVNEMVKGEKH